MARSRKGVRKAPKAEVGAEAPAIRNYAALHDFNRGGAHLDKTKRHRRNDKHKKDYRYVDQN